MFLIFAKSIDCGYTLEPPRHGGSMSTHNLCFGAKKKKKKKKKNRYTPANPEFYYIEVGFASWQATHFIH